MKSPFYYLIHVSDEIKCINKNEIPDLQARVLAGKSFIKDLDIMVVQGSFYFGVYKYARTGSLYDWMVVFKVTLGASYKSQSVIEAIDDADKKAPIFLSRKETSDYFTSV